MFCNRCGEQLPEGTVFCTKCGNQTGSAVPGGETYPMPAYSAYSAYPQKKKSGCLKIALIAVAAVAVIGLILLLIGVILSDTPYEPTFSGYENQVSYSMDYDYESGGVYGTSLDIPNLRSPYTAIKGDGTDTVTVMVYMIGSDLESGGGYATEDLLEMQQADFSDSLNLVVQTGGTTAWANDLMENGSCQRWLVSSEGFIELENIGTVNMTDGGSLSDFVVFCAENYPADRYELILWDHGGGTMCGYGYDENFPNDSMNLYELDTALNSTGVKFDFIGFDACLMSTFEVAYSLGDYADYLVASEETEPGCGWYYTDWLSEFSSNPSADTVSVCRNIIDDFIDKAGELDYRAAATLSVVDLREMPYLYDTLCGFLGESSELLSSYDYESVSRARNGAKDYGEGDYQQVDIADLAYRSSLELSSSVVDAVKSAVKYRNQTSDMYGSHGLAMYYPYTDYTYYNDVLDIQRSIGFEEDYTGFFSSFLNAMMSGRAEDSSELQDYDWYDESEVESYAGEMQTTDYGELVIEENADGDFVLHLTDEQWANLTAINLEAALDDGEGYIELGIDNVWTCDDNGDLLVEFDYTWVSVNGQTVPFYVEYEYDNGEDDWSTYGYSFAYVDDEYVEVLIYWDNENPHGYVAGYRPYYGDDSVSAKGVLPLEEGMVVEFYFDYYDYDWNYLESYCFFDPITITSEPLTVSYEDVGDLDSLIWYNLTDIYQNTYHTESVVYY